MPGAALIGGAALATGIGAYNGASDTTKQRVKEVAKATAASTAGYGAYLGHKSIMANYGGEGGAKEAYRNAGRNIARSAKDGGSALLDTLVRSAKSAKRAVLRK